MYQFLYFMNSLSTWVGKAFAWCIIVMTLGTTYEVIARYGFDAPTGWAFDMSYIMYGTLFMMGGAYTLCRDGHVRGDVIFRLWPARGQAWIELVLYFVFFFPGMAALVYAGIDYAAESWSYQPYGPRGPSGEVSIFSPIGVPVSPLKTILPVAATLMILQGTAEVTRCIICIRTGQWPRRMHDVEELQDVLLKERERALEHSMRLDAQPDSGQAGQHQGEQR